MLRLVSGLTLGAILMIGGCGDPDDEALTPAPAGGWSTAGCELARQPESIMVGGLTMPTTPAALDAAITRIDQGGRHDFRESYAGIEVDQERVRALVYRVPSAPFDDFIRQAAQNTCIVVRDAPHSAADLGTWHDRIVADLSFWTARGIRIVTIGARHDGSGVEVGTQDPDRARLELPARYGSRAPLVIVDAAPVQPFG
ncbi:hypothetical protein [Actinoplanes sp. NPDC051411]|uniref:hypothetical protein n=1 Tax=Actinoplanes sp. NPDC051411 TaxID=3155522 RepID=UPI003439A9F1